MIEECSLCGTPRIQPHTCPDNCCKHNIALDRFCNDCDALGLKQAHGGQAAPKAIAVSAQQFACAMLIEAEAASLHRLIAQLTQMELKSEAEEIRGVLEFLGRRKASIEGMWVKP